MNKNIVFLSIIGSLGVGICIGAFSTKVYFEEKYKELANEEIQSVKNAFSRKEKAAVPEQPIELNDSVHDIPSYNEGRVLFSHDEVFTDYSSKAESEHPAEEDFKPPYFIDIDDFDAVLPVYDKKELVYYMDDGTLLDDEENILSIVDTVGSDNLEEFENSLESCCYIRNEKLQEDYEVSKIFGSYGSLLNT